MSVEENIKLAFSAEAGIVLLLVGSEIGDMVDCPAAASVGVEGDLKSGRVRERSRKPPAQ